VFVAVVSIFLFVSRITQKPVFTTFGGKVALGPQKKPLNCDGIRIRYVSVTVR